VDQARTAFIVEQRFFQGEIPLLGQDKADDRYTAVCSRLPRTCLASMTIRTLGKITTPIPQSTIVPSPKRLPHLPQLYTMLTSRLPHI
jgi:hypothetical protein